MKIITIAALRKARANYITDGGDIEAVNEFAAFLESQTDEVPEIPKIRRAVANYMRSEGCSCCADYDGHKIHAAELGKLLKVPMYRDKSGYNFSKFRTRERKRK